MYTKIFLLSICLLINFKSQGASSTLYTLETTPSSAAVHSIQNIQLTPQEFIEWSEKNRGSIELLNLCIKVHEQADLTTDFWAQLIYWAENLKDFKLINQIIPHESLRPMINLEPLKTLNCPHLSEFIIIGLNPSRTFIESFHDLPFCASLKKLIMYNCGRLDDREESQNVIDLEQIRHLVNIPALRSIEVLDLDLMDTPEAMDIIAASPHITLSQCVLFRFNEDGVLR